MKKVVFLSFMLLAGSLTSFTASADDICELLCRMQVGGKACNCSVPSLP